MAPGGFEDILTGSKRIEEETQARTIGYIEAGLGVVAGFAWNEAIKALIEFLFPLDKGTVIAKFIYAGVITVFVVIFSLSLAKVKKKPVSP